jgi:DNA-binding CsgD family transcriptional regulator
MERFPISPNGFPHLTPRQQQVVMLIAEDLSAKEIGKRAWESARRQPSTIGI